MNPGCYPPEGCAPERPTAFERLAKNSPSTAVLIEYAEQTGYLRAENRYVRGEAQAFERKLNEAEAREVELARSNKYLKEDNRVLDSALDESEQELSKLKKKLAPKAKKVVKKTVKKGKK